MENEIVLNKDQSQIFENFKKNEDEDIIYSLEGKAGTGKSTLTSELIKYLYNREQVIACIAPTHQALKVLKQMVTKAVGNSWKNNNRIKFATVHSYLGLTLQIDDDGNEIFGKSSFNKYNARIECDYLFCDESSMVPNELSLKIRKSLTSDDNPQIRKQLIYVGDPYQLKPVNGEFNFVLNPDLKKTVGYSVQHRYLHQVVRQAEGSSIINLAHKITDMIDDNSLFNEEEFFEMLYHLEKGDEDKTVITDAAQFMEAYFNSDEEDENKIVGCYTNNLVQQYNRYIRWTILQEDYPDETVPDVVSHDRIVFLHPYERNQTLVANNGDTCRIDKVQDKSSTVQNVLLEYFHCSAHLEDALDNTDLNTRITLNILKESSRPAFEKKCQELSNEARMAQGRQKSFLWKKFFSFKNKYANVRSIYANTNHKLQGSTFNEVYLNTQEYRKYIKRDLDNILRLIYVAITRGRKITLLK